MLVETTTAAGAPLIGCTLVAIAVETNTTNNNYRIRASKLPSQALTRPRSTSRVAAQPRYCEMLQRDALASSRRVQHPPGLSRRSTISLHSETTFPGDTPPRCK